MKACRRSECMVTATAITLRRRAIAATPTAAISAKAPPGTPQHGGATQKTADRGDAEGRDLGEGAAGYPPAGRISAGEDEHGARLSAPRGCSTPRAPQRSAVRLVAVDSIATPSGTNRVRTGGRHV